MNKISLLIIINAIALVFCNEDIITNEVIRPLFPNATEEVLSKMDLTNRISALPWLFDKHRPKDEKGMPVLTQSDKEMLQKLYTNTSGQTKASVGSWLTIGASEEQKSKILLELVDSNNIDEYSSIISYISNRLNSKPSDFSIKEKRYLGNTFKDKFNNTELNEQLSDFQKKKLEELQTIYFPQYATDNQTKDSKINPNLLTNNTPQTDQPKQTEQKPKAQEEVETIKAAATTTSEKQTPTWLIYALAALGLIVLLLVIKKLKNKE